MSNFDWVKLPAFRTLEKERAASLDAALQRADEAVAGAAENVRRALRRTGEPADKIYLYACINFVFEQKKIADTIRGLRDALDEEGKL